VELLAACRAAGWPERWAVLGPYLTLLAAFPDSHVQRKHGAEAARRLQGEGAALDRILRSQASPQDALEQLLEADRDFKRRGVNPGTTADLTVAAHFASALAAAMT
jgi:triphosphoribosyl-dephospho-CoA synthase